MEPFAQVEPESEVKPGSKEQTADHSSLIGIVVAVACLVVLVAVGAFILVTYRKRKGYKVRFFKYKANQVFVRCKQIIFFFDLLVDNFFGKFFLDKICYTGKKL